MLLYLLNCHIILVVITIILIFKYFKTYALNWGILRPGYSEIENI